MSEPLSVRCCVCKKFRVNGVWVEWPGHENDEDASDTYCPPCAEKTIAEMRDTQVDTR